ncbi:unnamed protein product [Rotaria magnacalcarata]|uniref:Uncharacterized protein n=2 Tax=Rotaria magnacalcarata TaxID=392030 RepID=A0A814P7J3_9BILA|nr:unnamed protein product [Rotaria magnacalcarata]CAF1485568.1 unnamed protein product [Rotaria magnacalcarata]
MQDRLISLVNTGIPDGKSKLELKNNGCKSGRVYKLIQKEQQQLLNVRVIYLHVFSANEEVKDPDEDDQEMREQLYQDLDAEMNDDQTSTLDIPESSNSDDSQEQYISSTTNISSVTTAVIVKHRRVKRVYMLRTSPYGLRKRNGMRLLELWFDTQYRNQPWSLISIIGLIDVSLSIHKFPPTICRTLRTFLKYTDFKAGELRYTLLFVLTSFSIYLPHKHGRHLLLLVVLAHRCESKSTSSDRILNIKRLANEFIYQFPLLYGDRQNVISIHTIMHLPESTINFWWRL